MTTFSTEVTPSLFGEQLDALTPVFNLKSFGAKCDAAATNWLDPTTITGTDDTAKVQGAIDAAHAIGGGTIFIPANCLCDGKLDVAQKSNITFTGPSGHGPGYDKPPPASLIYAGADARFVDARSSFSIVFRDIGVRYMSGSFTGSLIDYSHSIAADATYGLVERCLVGGIGVHSAGRLVDLLDAIICQVVNSHLCWGQVGVGGKLESSPGYSNAHTFTRNTFDNLTTAAILNPGEAWSIHDNTFEGTNGGTGGMPRALYDNFSPGASLIQGLTWRDNWCGDDAAVADAWFSVNNSTVRGLSISGGFMSNTSGGKSIKLPAACEGVSITGVRTDSIDLGSAAHSGLTINGSYITNDFSNLSNSALDIMIFANRKFGGYGATVMRIANPQEMALGDPFGATSNYAKLTGLSEIDMHATKVLGLQGALIADATDAGSAITQLNAVLARLRAHGLIAP